MYHFVAMLWNADDAAAREDAAQLQQRMRLSSMPWETLLAVDGLSVFASPPTDPSLRSYLLPGKAGVVLGKLFSADLTQASLDSIDQIEAHTAAEMVRTAGGHLARNFWGGYVALLTDRQAGCHYAIRDCSGKLPCYSRRHRGVTIVFADINDLTPLELPSPTLNWEYLASFIHSSQMQVRDCALKEISEVLAGECLTVQGGAARQTVLWDPRSICRERVIDRYEDAVLELRSVARKCIDAWARGGRPMLLGLSGGFDSATVLGLLSDSSARPPITCVNQYSTAPLEDERKYARAAAERAGVKLVEVPMVVAADRFGPRLLDAPPTSKPAAAALFRFLEIDLINSIAQEAGAHALWTGQGGDHVFLQTTYALSATDFLQRHGPRPGFLAAVHDAARLSRQPYWFVLKSALARSRDVGPSTSARKPCFVNPAALPANIDHYVAHPWAADAQDIPPGKHMQIRFLAEVVNRHRPIARLERAPQHHPLLSQPLMAVCLRIPTYNLLRGGRERSLAREAFAAYVPTEILRRRDKGSIVGYTTEMLRQSEPFVRELLLEGELAGAGVLVRKDLEPYLVKGNPFREEHLPPLLACIAAEVWVRTCKRAVAAVAA